MPSRNIVKKYLENGYYHLYNRGVEKRKIFMDQQDYSVFLSYLRDYLLPKDEESLYQIISSPNSSSKEKDRARKLLRLNNFSKEITLLTYCLMPNHFHFFIKQKSSGGIDMFMNSLGTRYSMYFNKKHKRIGNLYQDTYKALLLESQEHFLHLSRYIHKQALASQGDPLQSWEGQPSSYEDYLGKRKTGWVHPEEILSFFSNKNPSLSYESFVAQAEDNPKLLEHICLEDD